ncbi:MAG: PhoPQ-activated protein PqaA family protein [bacterium]
MLASRPPRPAIATAIALALGLLVACDDGGDGDDRRDALPGADAALDRGADGIDAGPDAIAPDAMPAADAETADAETADAETAADAALPEPDAAPPRPPLDGPLGEYVAAPDDAYGWALVDEDQSPAYRAWRLRVDSQNWRTPDEVDRTLWTHTVTLLVPPAVDTTTALVVIDGGSNRDEIEPLDAGDLTLALTLATQIRAPVALISQIPNQPLTFTDVGERYSEDALVAWTWRKAMDTGDLTWPAYLPMVKGAVRSLDAIQAFTAEAIDDIVIDDFVLTGFSKRGATTWLTAAVDDRVRAMAPGVFDVLHMEAQIVRHYGAYGFYSEAIEDYVEQGVIEKLGTPESLPVIAVVDPITYADRFTMPKLVLSAGGDEFFLPDAGQLYLHELPGETHYRQFPNTGHGMDNALADVVITVVGFFRAVVERTPRPQVTWTHDGDTLTVTGTPAPASARLWTASNPAARDFRNFIVGEDAWSSTPLEVDADGTVRVTLTPPAEGFTAYMVDMSFTGGSRRQVYGTPSFIAPDVLPFADQPLPPR